MNGAMILNSSIVLATFLIIIGILYSFFSSKNLKKKRKEMRKLYQNLHPGVEVFFSGGLTGVIESIDNEFAQILLAKGLSIKISRFAITEIISKKQKVG